MTQGVAFFPPAVSPFLYHSLNPFTQNRYVMRWAVVVGLLAVVVISEYVEAHKSAKDKKPLTEEDAHAHHLFHRRMPPAEDGDHVHHHRHLHGSHPSDEKPHRSPLYHHRYGPSYPEHHNNKQSHFNRPRYNKKGEEVPAFVQHEDIDKDHLDHHHLHVRAQHE